MIEFRNSNGEYVKSVASVEFVIDSTFDTSSFDFDHSLVGGEGFEPVKAVPSDLQSDPFDRSGNPPRFCHASVSRASRLQSDDELAEGLEPTTC